MKILVCVKQVPDMESAFRPDAGGAWYDEEDLAFKVNEYDEYAVEAAVRLKAGEGAGTDLVVLTVGPARASDALKKALAMGCDRAVHVRDDAAHEKDPAQIAGLIHAWAGGQGFDLVFTGIQSQDRGSAQVGVLLAARLGIPAVSAVSEFVLEGGALRARVDLEGGLTHTVRVVPPALVTFQTGPDTPRYPTVPNIMAAKRKPIEVIDVSTLAAGEQMLDTVRVAAPANKGAALVLEGDAAQIAERLLELLRQKTTVLDREGIQFMKALLIGECRQGVVREATYETVAFAARAGAEASMFVVAPSGAPPSFDGTLYHADVARYHEYDPEAHLRLVLAATEKATPDLVVLLNSAYGLDMAPRIAAALGCAQISDVVDYADGVFTVPACNAKLRREVRALTAKAVVTLQPGAFPGGEAARGAPRVESLDVGELASPYASLGIEAQPRGDVDLTREPVIVSAGRGIGKRDNLALVEALARALGGQVGASRPVVDAGWAEHFRQVGVSGATVAPKLYVACGISGAVQHLAGMKGAEFVVGINTDADAPLAEVADVMVIADVAAFLPVLTAKIDAAG